MELPMVDNAMNDESLAVLLEKMSINAGEIQEHVLSHIIRKNEVTEYLTSFLGHGLNTYAVDDVKHLFKKSVPLVEYEDILPYVHRIANGEPHSILSGDPIVELTCSSATSGGKHKWFPKTAQDLSQYEFYTKLRQNILNMEIGEGVEDGGKRLVVHFLSPENTTPSGLVVRTAVTSLLRRQMSKIMYWNTIFTSPDGVRLCQDVKQSMYSHLLCGLVQRDLVVIVGCLFAVGLFRLIKFFEQNWKEICSDIRTGCVSDWIKDTKCREAVASVLCQPMPELADSIERECMKNSWEGIIKTLWPRTKCLEVIVTGSMAQYIPKLEFYAGREIPLVSMIYAASEGYFGINLKPLSSDSYDVSYCLIPWMAYYEFLPISDESSNGEVVDLTNVKIGQHYELVVTTFSGLYRYRMGDILMVTGFMNSIPQFRFVQRKNVILSIITDRTTEEDLLKAVSKATCEILEPLGFILTDYTSCVSLSPDPGHYVLFWELHSVNGLEASEVDDVAEQMVRCCNVVDESLDISYWEWRVRNSIGPLEIRIVKRGAFDEFMEFRISEVGTSLSQFKTPRCIQSEKAIQFFNSTVVATYFSRVVMK